MSLLLLFIPFPCCVKAQLWPLIFRELLIFILKSLLLKNKTKLARLHLPVSADGYYIFSLTVFFFMKYQWKKYISDLEAGAISNYGQTNESQDCPGQRSMCAPLPSHKASPFSLR